MYCVGHNALTQKCQIGCKDPKVVENLNHKENFIEARIDYQIYHKAQTYSLIP